MTSSVLISVIICTYNPRPDYLIRVLQALDSQTLSKELWELLLIDNASSRILSDEIDLRWHLNSRHIREEQLGLTPARLRGIEEAKSDILVFVDDDNVIDANYLEECLNIFTKYPYLGAIGGSITAETEKPIEEWQKPFLSFLAIRTVSKPIWGNTSVNDQNLPYGAGMCIRREVAIYYKEVVKNDPVRILLDRRGTFLSSGGDTDLAFTSYDCNYGTGIFPSLKLLHLIPNKRLSLEYLLRLRREGGTSGYILDYIRNGRIPNNPNKNLILAFIEQIRLLKLTPLERKMRLASNLALKLALQEIKNIATTTK
ncbi:glycosyltransferase [Pseudanabaena yagii]|uniref:Glycosyltransferase n=1 Tax=Pseudanabaena yagii GIHE-NHR1 TaxID=2722753 RepID=A0ABX1LMX9_9CYAN|nr:glycosyltransferase [Pseudanabaena yagii]NMF56641.1 glycosyltransferase [Pseudanabaena yagii GIHE-NHR1]